MDELRRITNPAYYRDTPPGIGLECIEYVRHLPFSQGNAAKYIYRAGRKGDPAADIGKALWYLTDALLVPPVYLDRVRPDLAATIHPLTDWRARAFGFTVSGQFRLAAKMITPAG